MATSRAWYDFAKELHTAGRGKRTDRTADAAGPAEGVRVDWITASTARVGSKHISDPVGRFGLARQIRVAAEEAGFPLTLLTVEVTETALVNNLERARTIVRELKGMGCRLALDDFGTGYSNLLHLQGLPFDELKVDARFVRSMTDTRESGKIVAAIVGLGHSLGLISLAEAIETEEQAEMLLRLGCELGQGWLYGRAPRRQIESPISCL